MATPNYNLPTISGNMTADVVRDMNALAEATDSAIEVATSTIGEGVAAHIADGTAHGIGNKATLLTTNKASIVAAINELFTNANSLKSDWAGVVGSPLLTSDTSAQLKSKTQSIKNTLASNLTAKGQSSVGTETLTALVNKVANVSTGKKTASGTGTTNSSGTLIVNGLSFRPRNIIVQRIGYRTNTVIYSEDARYADAPAPINKFAQNGSLDIYNVVTIDSSGFAATMENLPNTNITYFASE